MFLKEIHEEFPGSRVVPTVHCAVDPDTLWNVRSKRHGGTELAPFFPTLSVEQGDEQGTAEHHPHHHSDHHHHGHDHHHDCESHAGIQAPEAGYVSFYFRDDRPLDESLFASFLAELPWEVFRVKGPVRFPDKTLLVNFVGGKAEWIDWEDVGTSLAFVAWKVDSREILSKLERCVAPA